MKRMMRTVGVVMRASWKVEIFLVRGSFHFISQTHASGAACVRADKFDRPCHSSQPRGRRFAIHHARIHTALVPDSEAQGRRRGYGHGYGGPDHIEWSAQRNPPSTPEVSGLPYYTPSWCFLSNCGGGSDAIHPTLVAFVCMTASAGPRGIPRATPSFFCASASRTRRPVCSLYLVAGEEWQTVTDVQV